MRQALKAVGLSFFLVLAACGSPGPGEPTDPPTNNPPTNNPPADPGPLTLTLTPSEVSSFTSRCVPVTVSLKYKDGSSPVTATVQFKFSGEIGNFDVYEDGKCTRRSYNSLSATEGSLTFYVLSNARLKTLLTVSSGDASAPLSYVSEPLTGKLELTLTNKVQAGECVPMTVKRIGYDNLPTTVEDSSFTVEAYDTSGRDYTQIPKLHTDKDCQTAPLAKVLLAKGESATTVYFRSTKAYSQLSVIVVPAESRLERVYKTLAVASGPTEKLFVDPAQTSWAAGDCTKVTIWLADAYDNVASTTSSGVPVALSSSAGGALGYFTDDECQVPVSAGSIPAGYLGVYAYARGLGGGAVDLQVDTQPPLKPGRTRVQVAPAVRRGSCTLDGANYVSCPISPAVKDTTQAFFTFQTRGATRGAAASAVRCYLSTTSTLTCSRKGGSGRVDIAWQLTELATGLRVWHLNGFCTGASTPLAIQPFPNTSVYPRPEHSFVLFSAEQNGAEAGSASFATAVLQSNSQVEVINGAGTCAAGNAYSVQVVDMNGLSVSRGVSDATSDAVLDITTPTQAAAARSLVLSTHQASEPSTAAAPALCNRLLRGEVVDDSTLRFSRALGQGCSPGLVTRVSWERLTANTRASLRSSVVTLGEGERQVTAVLDGAMDPTRTLLLSGSQTFGGQGGGETDATTGGVPGVALAHFNWEADTSQVTVSRDSTQGRARWTVYALQLEP